MPIKHTSVARLRFQNSAARVAVTYNALLRDLMEVGHVSKNKPYLTLDKKKIPRAQNLILQDAVEAAEAKAHEDEVAGVYYDDRTDNTLVLLRDDETGRHRRILVKGNVAPWSNPGI